MTLSVISASDILQAKLLVVDDKLANVMLLERILFSAGYTSITSTQNPYDVCPLHELHHFDLILLDLQMPGLDGFDVMEKLKKIEGIGYLPVLVITAQPEEKLRALKAGAKDFISKPFDIAEVLARVHNLLEVRLLHLESQRLYQQVLQEQHLSDRLLQNMLPQSIIERLKDRPAVIANHFSEVIADHFPEVSVLFADIVGFTSFSEKVSATVLVNVLNDIFTHFDTVTHLRGLEKIKTIGDSYMAVAGLPLATSNHAEQAAHLAFDMLEVMDQFNARSDFQFKIRIGISSGAVVAGIIGKHKFLYDVWGDVVNVASRMESQGLAGCIQVSDSTRQRLGVSFLLEKRDNLDICGKGKMQTWLLNGR